jgi:hypothetical protein
MALPKHGAWIDILGVVSANADWNEVVVIETGNLSTGFAPSTGFTNDTWHLTFRKSTCVGAGADLTLSSSSTDAGLTYTESSTLSTLLISTTLGTLAALNGDYTVDIASKSTGGVLTHWAHGVITVQNDPVSW